MDDLLRRSLRSHTDAYCDANCIAHGHADTDFNAYSYSYGYGNADGDTYTDGNAYVHTDGDGYGYGNSDANTDANGYGYGYVHADSYSNSYSYGNSDLNADSTRGEAITDAAAASNNTATAPIVDSGKWNTSAGNSRVTLASSPGLGAKISRHCFRKVSTPFRRFN